MENKREKSVIVERRIYTKVSDLAWREMYAEYLSEGIAKGHTLLEKEIVKYYIDHGFPSFTKELSEVTIYTWWLTKIE